jgi:hypothetical protein
VLNPAPDAIDGSVAREAGGVVIHDAHSTPAPFQDA